MPVATQIINVTAHPIVFEFAEEDGGLMSIPPCGKIVNATVEETEAYTKNGVTYVQTVFRGNDDDWHWVENQKALAPDCIIVGSIIAAQAYPEYVAAMVPMPGFERVPPDQKRMNPYKFTIFPKREDWE